MDKTDAILFTILAIVVLLSAGAIGWDIAGDQYQNEAILTHNAHWETLPDGRTIFKWNNK